MQLPNLSNLGVPIRQQNEVPSAEAFPTAFNQNCFKYWQQAVGDVVEKRKVSNPRQAWTLTIQRFIRICEQNHAFPFYDQQTSNDLIFTLLLRGRRQVVRFIDSSKILDEMTPYKTLRSVSMSNTGFKLTVESQVNRMEEPPSVLDKLGLRQHSKTGSGSVWKIALDRDVEFFVRNEGPMMSLRWYFGYDLSCPVFPHIPGNHTPSTKELEKFVMDVIYLPILRAFRPIKSNNRLI